jgi:hypothetical protein
MYGHKSYGDTESISWVDSIDRWRGLEGEWEWMVDNWSDIISMNMVASILPE